jgi:hypothetical protein
MKIVRTPAPPAPKSSIIRFDQPAPTSPPSYEPVRSSNDVAAHAVRIASSPGGIDPRQRHN